MLTTLKNDFLTVTASSCGAEMQSITGANGIEYLWDGHAPYWNRRSPTLFPIIGALRNNFAVSEQGEIHLPKHGFCRSAPFEVVEQTDTSVTYCYTDNEDTREMYPYAFRFCVTHAIDGDSVKTTYAVTNTGDCTLPFCVGGHPAFHVPLVPGEEYTDYAVEFEQKETADCPSIDLQSCLVNDSIKNRLLSDETTFRLNHVLFRGDALVFDDLKSDKVKLVSLKSGHGVEMEFSDFPTFAVWSMADDEPFVCFEPWHGGATRTSEDDVFEHKNGCVLAAPGETCSFTYSMRIF